MKRRWGRGIAALLGLGIAMAGPARAQVVINGVNEGSSYTVPSTGVTAVGESIGSGGGTISQSVGQNNSGSLEIGLGNPVFPFSVGTGTYNLTGGTVLASTEQLGLQNGIGIFDQLNGTNKVGTLSLLGQTVAAGVIHGSATYTLGGGTLIANIVSVGDGTAGDQGLFQFTGGTADFFQMQINLGGSVTASGAEILDGANPTNTTRSITQSAGSNTVTGSFELGVSGTTTITNGVVTAYTPNLDTYTLNGGTLSAASESLGTGGNAQFVQGGGTNTVQSGGTLAIGSAGYQAAPGISGGGVASYTLSQGTLTAPSISVASSGTLEFNGGAADFGTLDSFGTLSASGNEVLDQAGATNTSYRVNQRGGSNSVSGALEIGASGTTGTSGSFVGNTGFYNLENSSPLSAAAEVVGLAGTGTLDQTSGTNTIAPNGASNVTLSDGSTLAAGTLMLGDAATSSGTYDLDGLTAQLTAGAEVVGNNGQGSFVQGSGTNTTGTLTIAQGSGGGSYTLLGGTLTATGDVTVNANGSFAFNGGSLATNLLTIAGTVTATGDEQVTGIGAASVVTTLQSGGSNTVAAGTLYVASNTNSGQRGLYSLQAGTLSAQAETIAAGINSFTQSGGTNSATTLTVASSGTEAGYLLSGGTLHAGTIDIAAAGSMLLGGGTLDFGQMNLSGTLSATGNEVLDSAGQTHSSYIVTQTAGTNGAGIGALELGAAAGNSATYTLSGGSMSFAAEVVGLAGTANVTQTGGTNTLTGAGGPPLLLSNGSTVSQGTLALGLAPGSVGTYSLQGGTLTGNVAVSSASTFFLSGGSVVGGVVNNGLFAETTGGAAGALTNNAAATVAGSMTASQVTNAGQFTLNGGTVSTTAGFTNNSTVSGNGGIAGTGAFLNTNLFTQSGGGFTLSATGANDNTGEIDLAPGTTAPFQIATGSTLANDGLIKLNGGTLSGGGILDNTSGLIGGTGRIATAQFRNEGTLTVDSGLTSLTPVSGAVINAGVIQATSTSALLTGSVINNTGTIEGVGRINNSIGDTGGTIQALGGTLTLGGPVTTTKQTTLIAGAGGQLLLTGAFTDEATISLAGGNFDDASGQAISNNGTISGYGVFTASALANAHTILVAGGTGTFNGSVVNNQGATITVDHAAAVFNGAVTNNGTITTHVGTASYAGTFTNNGTVISDPSTQTFSGDLVESSTGVIQAAAGDRYVVEGGFLNHSTQNTAWNTSAATLEFAAGGASALHALALAGADLGTGAAGYQNNFAWNTLAIDSGQSLSLSDGVSAANVAFYTDILTGAVISGNSITNITGNGYNIYYDPLFATNLYLGGLTYNLASGGQLIADSVPTPEPADGVLLAGFVLILVGLRPYRR